MAEKPDSDESAAARAEQPADPRPLGSGRAGPERRGSARSGITGGLTSGQLLATAAAAMVAGGMVSVQSKINAELAVRVDGSVAAAWISFAVGLVAVLAIALVHRPIRTALRRIPQVLRDGDLRWWQLIGGAAGAWLVTTQGIVVPLVGVTAFTIGVVAGQVIGSLLVDRLGMSPAGVLPVTVLRALGAVMAVVAVTVTAWPELTGSQPASWALLVALSAGAGTAAQQAVNSRVSVSTGQPLAATTVNFTVGLVVLTLGLGLGAVFAGPPAGSLPTEAWYYLGGPVGVVFIALAAWAVRPLGVLRFGLLAISGQLLASVGIDLLFPSGTPLGWNMLVGLLLLGAAVVVASRGRKPLP